MGFKSYGNYLKSRLWASVRSRVLSRDNGECLSCGAAAKHVHHASYSEGAMRGEDISLLYSLCHSCHEEIEFGEDGKLSFQDASKKTIDKCWYPIEVDSYGRHVGRKIKKNRLQPPKIGEVPQLTKRQISRKPIDDYWDAKVRDSLQKIKNIQQAPTTHCPTP